MRKHLLPLCATIVASAYFASSAPAQIVFDNSSRQDFHSSRAAGSSPIAAVTVGSTQFLNQIGVSFDPSASGNLRFLVFDLGTSNLLFSTAATGFTDVGSGIYLSPIFAPFQLNVGTTYGIGAIADVAGGWGTNNSSSGNPFSQGGFTVSDDLNGNVANFGAPTIAPPGAAMIIVQLGVAEVTAVPEPGTLGLVACGLAATALLVRRRRPVDRSGA